MLIDAEQAMIEFGESGYNCYEVPDFIGDEPMLVFYNPEYLHDQFTLSSLKKIPPILAENESTVSWDDGIMKADGMDFFCQGHDAKYLTVSTMGAGEWMCVVQCIACVSGEHWDAFTLADMFDVMREELAEQGIIPEMA